ncbi:MAG: hypothetical protein IJU23_10335 [Proteobacteria bacterium]|nr:hypothetical protein [Pseudomonadota bacterium]
MTHSYEGTTLALQHYYDLVGSPRKLPLLMVYPANEQPFGSRMMVWMATWHDVERLSESTCHRLDEALLRNRAVSDPHILRVLDYGSSEGNSFVVTDAIQSLTLRSWLRTHGHLQLWQGIRLLEQLTGILTAAHNAGFHGLCLTSDNIYIRDEERFDIQTGPLGIGLYRSEILDLRDVTITTDMMRHIPPWEYQIHKNDAAKTDDKSADNEKATESDNTDEQADKPAEQQDAPSETVAETDNPTDDMPSDDADKSENADNIADKSDDKPVEKDDSIQELAAEDVVISQPDAPEIPDNLCPDVYAVAAILYEGLCGQHPYFSDGCELCDSALLMAQGNPPELIKRIDISEALNDVVMKTLRTPLKDSAPQLLADFSAQCPQNERDLAHQAEKSWLTPPQSSVPEKRQKQKVVSVRHPFILAAVAAAILFALSVGITWKLAQFSEPVDLFSLPQIMPAAEHDGVDIVLATRTPAPNIDVYMTTFDGRPVRLGRLPYTHRQQQENARIDFLLADEYGHTQQVPVKVHGDDGMMLVLVELNW